MAKRVLGASVIAFKKMLYVAFVSGVLVVPRAAWAQLSGGIAGEATDTTGAVLPGVTVEVASPALIEKVRVAVTDARGQYAITDLVPGTYSVKFSLSGFSVVQRQGIELYSGLTAKVTAEMRVGSLEETVTVSGASPVVDVRNVRTQNVLLRETLDTLPTGKSIGAFTALTLGAGLSYAGGHDVGGNQPENAFTISVHGAPTTDQKLMIDGMRYNSVHGGGSTTYYLVDQVAVQEVAMEVGGITAESETGGAQLNYVLKDGGNTFSTYFLGNYAGASLQSSNLSDELRARGLSAQASIRKIYDIGGGVGGRIIQDKLWFYTAHRWWGSQEYQPNSYFNATPHSVIYTPDLNRPGFQNIYNQDHSLRLTWQATGKQKVTINQSLQDNCLCFFYSLNSNSAPEATDDEKYKPIYLTHVSWSYPATNRLLFQAGAMYNRNRKHSARPPGVGVNDIAVVEQSTGFRYNAKATSLGVNDYQFVKTEHNNGRLAVSYVTGSHTFKAGFTWISGFVDRDVELNDPPVSYLFRKPTPNAAPVPQAVTYWASPNRIQSNTNSEAVYVQDQWALRKLTLNLGVRFDRLHSSVPAGTRPAGRFVAAVNIPAQDNLPNWKDVTPRLGAAYDLFGNGKTALKVSLGRYVNALSVQIAEAVSPANAVVTNATRIWTDQNGDYVPQESELGPLSNSAFGTVVVNSGYADDLLAGWGVRPYNWQGSVGLQQELGSGVALTAGYFRTSFGNFTVTDNVLVTPADHDPFCISAPVDARLGSASGQQMCGLYDLSKAKFGGSQSLVTSAAAFGSQSQVYNGADVAISARFGRGGLFSGGMTFGNTVTDTCIAVDSPQALRPGFCRSSAPLNQVKISGAYPLPWGFQVSAVFQNYQGAPILANVVVSNAAIAPSLGRNLSSCANATGACNATATIAVIEPNTMFEDRLNQIDLRVTKFVRIGKIRVKGMVDAYNLLNAGTILLRNQTYGASWGTPQSVLAGRFVKFGAQVDF